MCPNEVDVPVPTTTAWPKPACTTVPIRAQSVSSLNAAPAGTGRVSLVAGIDSPVRIDSSHSSSAVASSRTSAGTMSPSRRSMTSPGTSDVTGTASVRPLRMASARCEIWECRASAARAARYSLTKPSPTDSATITSMITASLRSPTKNDVSAAASSRASSGDRSWCHRTDSGPARWDTTAFGPYRSSRPAGLGRGEAGRTGAESAQHLLAR